MQISVGEVSLTCFLILELSLNMKKRSAADDVAYEDISYKKSKKKPQKTEDKKRDIEKVLREKHG